MDQAHVDETEYPTRVLKAAVRRQLTNGRHRYLLGTNRTVAENCSFLRFSPSCGHPVPFVPSQKTVSFHPVGVILSLNPDYKAGLATVGAIVCAPVWLA